MSQRLVVSAGCLLLIFGCGGGTHWSAENSWTGEEEKASPSAKPESSAEGAPDVSAASTHAGPPGMVGGRHDLSINPKPAKSARCSCLAVEVGATNESKFAWETGAPSTPGDALAIAISPRGVPCPGGDSDENKRRASISAVDRNGGDIIVE